MAAASVFKVRNKPSDQIVFDFTPSTSYPAGGELMSSSLLGFQSIDGVFPVPCGEDGTVLFTYNPVTQRLRIFTAVGVEAGTGTDQSAKRVRLLVMGSGASIASN